MVPSSEKATRYLSGRTPGGETAALDLLMFSNDILSDIIVIKAVTEKTVRNLNLNFKFLSNGNFR